MQCASSATDVAAKVLEEVHAFLGALDTADDDVPIPARRSASRWCRESQEIKGSAVAALWQRNQEQRAHESQDIEAY